MTGRHLFVLAIGVVAVSWAVPLIRLAEAPAIVIAALRLSMAAPPVMGAALLRRRSELLSLRRGDLAVMALAGLALAGHFAFWVAAVQRTSVITSVVLVTTQPLFVSIGAWIFLRERPSRMALIAIGIASAGAALLASDDLDDRGSLMGDLFAVTGAILASMYLVAGRRARASRSNLSYIAVVNSIAAVLLLLGVLLRGETLRGHPRDAYLFILLLALVPQLIGHSSFTWALGFIPAVVVAIAILGEPVGATLIAATMLDEVPTLLEWIGSAIVLLGVYVGLRSPSEPSEHEGRVAIEL